VSLTKKENNDPMAQQRRADHVSCIDREMREWREEFEKLYGSTPDSMSEEERAALVYGVKFKKIPEAAGKKTIDKRKPTSEIYGEEYFERKP